MYAGYMYIDLILFWKTFPLYSCTSEQTIIFYSYSLSIDITEEGSDVGDDSDDGDFEPDNRIKIKCLLTFFWQYS